MATSIRGKNLDLTEDLKDFATKKVESVTKLLESVIDIRIDLSKETNHHQKGDIYKASVDIQVPGNVYHAEENAEDIKTAINRVKQELQQIIKHDKGQRDAKRRETQKAVREMKEG